MTDSLEFEELKLAPTADLYAEIARRDRAALVPHLYAHLRQLFACHAMEGRMRGVGQIWTMNGSAVEATGHADALHARCLVLRNSEIVDSVKPPPKPEGPDFSSSA